MGTTTITEKEKSLLASLIFLWELKEEQEVLSEHPKLFFKSYGVSNSIRIAAYLIQNDFIQSIRIGKMKFEYSWNNPVRPNIYMVRNIIAGVRVKQNEENLKQRESVSSVSSHNEAVGLVKSDLVKKLESDIIKIEQILEEKKIALKVLKQYERIGS